MNASNIAFMSVNGKRYAVDLFNPMEAIGFGNRALAIFGPVLAKTLQNVDLAALAVGAASHTEGAPSFAEQMQSLLTAALAACSGVNAEEATKIMTDAAKRCYTPHNEALADEAVFNKWFRHNPADLYHVSVMALYHLVKDFFPKAPAMGANASKKGEAAATA